MQFTTIAALAAFTGLAFAEVKSYTGPLTAKDDSAGLHDCVESLSAHPGWNDGGWTCGDHHFQIGGSSWNSAADCVGGCFPGLLGAADLGADWYKCDQSAGVSAHCWVGWSPLGAYMCGNSDGSPCA